MKPLVVLVPSTGPEPLGLRAFVLALSDLVELRSEGNGPTISWSAAGVVVNGGTTLAIPAEPVNLDRLAPMPPFLRTRARTARGLPAEMVVAVDAPLSSVEVASLVVAGPEAATVDVVSALALGSVLVADATIFARLGLVIGEQALAVRTEVDEITAARLSHQAARWARCHHDSRRAALRAVELLGVYRSTPDGAVRQACVELHGGWVSRVDARVARVTMAGAQ